MELGHDTDPRLTGRGGEPWWRSAHDDLVKGLWSVSTALDAIEFFDGTSDGGDFERLAIAVDLWLDEAEERIRGTDRVLYQEEFEKLALGFMAYADSLRISTSAIWELYLLLTKEGAGEDEYGEPVDLPNLFPPRIKSERLLVSARGELTRVQLAHTVEWELEQPGDFDLYYAHEAGTGGSTQPSGSSDASAEGGKTRRKALGKAGRKKGQRDELVAKRRDAVEHLYKQGTTAPKLIADKLRGAYKVGKRKASYEEHNARNDIAWLTKNGRIAPR